MIALCDVLHELTMAAATFLPTSPRQRRQMAKVVVIDGISPWLPVVQVGDL